MESTDIKVAVSIGDFKVFGSEYEMDTAILTFPVSGESGVSVKLYNKEDFSFISEIPCDDFCRGRVCSVALSIKGGRWDSLCYRIREGKLEYVDTCAGEVLGRTPWGDRENHKNLYGGFVKSCFKNTDKPFVSNPLEMIIYKLHLRGFTMDKSRGNSIKGDARALLNELDYLKKLGVNTLEFMPLYEFDEILDSYGEEPFINFWGYGSDGYFFAPKNSYFGNEPVKTAFNFFETLKNNGFRIILEFSFNNSTMESTYVHAVRHWAFTYNIDGFRFLGSGVPYQRLISDPFLSDRLMFFEELPKHISFSENDGKRIFTENNSYIYPLRRLQNHMEGSVSEFCDMVIRKSDPFGHINYVANVNGFTLYDSYSYGEKHNQDNGENNRDGSNYNVVINNGVEGDTNDKVVLERRLSSIRMALGSLLVSKSVPLICAGDEMANSCQGNNNPYCQDNKIGWVNHSRKRFAQSIRDYLTNLIEFRKTHPILYSLPQERTLALYAEQLPHVSYHGSEPWIKNLEEGRKSVGIMLEEEIILLFNFNGSPESFALPRLKNKKVWREVTNTAIGEFYPKGVLIKNQKTHIIREKSLSILLAGEPGESDESESA